MSAERGALSVKKECALIAPHAASLDGEEETVLLHKRGGRGEEKVVELPHRHIVRPTRLP